ncbi:MAG: ABC transporter permease [Bacillota bacterium]
MSALVGKEIRQAWRAFRLPALYLTLLFLAIMDPLSTRYMGEILQKFATGITVLVPPPTAEMALGSFIGDIAEIGLLVIIATTMGAVAGEKASGVTAFIVTKPASRKSYVAAKYTVLAGGLAIGIVTSALLAALYTWTLIGPVQASRIILATLAVLIYAEFIMSATFAASMVASSGLAAGGAGLVIMIVTGIAGALLAQAPVGPWFPAALMRNATLLLSGGNPELIVKPGLAAVAASAALIWAGFAGFKRQALQ